MYTYTCGMEIMRLEDACEVLGGLNSTNTDWLGLIVLICLDENYSLTPSTLCLSTRS